MGAYVTWAWADGTYTVTETIYIPPSSVVATACLSDFSGVSEASAAAATISSYTPEPPGEPLNVPVLYKTGGVTSVTFALAVAYMNVANAAFTVITL